MIGIFTLLFFLIPATFAKEEFFKLYENKRPNSTLRYQTSDGYISYFQRNTGELVLSTKLQVHELLSSERNEHFFIQDSSFGEKILITRTKNFYQSGHLLPTREFFVSVLGENKTQKIDLEGYMAQLHLKDTWLGIFQQEKKMLIYLSLDNPEVNFQVKLNKNSNYFHIPQSILYDTQNLLFTDINSKRKFALMKLDRVANMVVPLFVASDNEQISLCYDGNTSIYMTLLREQGIKIYRYAIQGDKKLSAPQLLLDNPDGHGPCICDYQGKNLFFLKKVSINGILESKVFSFDVEKKELQAIEIKSNTTVMIDSLFRMGGSLFISSGDKYYVHEKML